eukprot:3872598-Rhodomonas_salina.1
MPSHSHTLDPQGKGCNSRRAVKMIALRGGESRWAPAGGVKLQLGDRGDAAKGSWTRSEKDCERQKD